MIGSWSSLDLDFYVVNLKQSERRRLRMEQQLSERRIRYRFVEAVDGDDIAAVRAAFVCHSGGAPRIYTPRKKPITSRELACTLSHMLAIRQAHDGGLRQALVCEDDLEIGDVDAGEMADILTAMPGDAGYVQLCILPAASVRGLARYHLDTRELFARKKSDQPTRFAEQAVLDLSCHSTGAYIITAAGMRNVCDGFFEGPAVRFPCDEQEISSNVGLAADRFVFQAAANERHPGYAFCIPTFLLEGAESLIHPEHVGDHAQARDVARHWRALIMGERVKSQSAR
jgi:GR25 family glycosyltransferase involved in LPS biosynthesis